MQKIKRRTMVLSQNAGRFYPSAANVIFTQCLTINIQHIQASQGVARLLKTSKVEWRKYDYPNGTGSVKSLISKLI